MHTQGQVLHIRRVCILCVYLHAHPVVGTQVEISLDLSCLAEEDKVAPIEAEFLVAQRRPFGNQVEVDASVCHLSLSANACSQLVVGIEDANPEGGTTFLQNAVEEGVEDELRVLLVVAYLSAKRQTFLAL